MCCRLRGRVKRHLHDYAGALVDLDAADRIEPNDLEVLRYVQVFSRSYYCIRHIPFQISFLSANLLLRSTFLKNYGVLCQSC